MAAELLLWWELNLCRGDSEGYSIVGLKEAQRKVRKGKSIILVTDHTELGGFVCLVWFGFIRYIYIFLTTDW